MAKAKAKSQSNQSSTAARVILSGFAAWVITLVVASITWISIVAIRGTHAADEALGELAVLYPMVMAIPFALLIACVTTPAVLAIRAMLGERRLWLGSAGAASAPLALIVMFAVGRLLFGQVRPTLWADLMAMARDPQGLPPILLALVLGGIALGIGVARRQARTVL